MVKWWWWWQDDRRAFRGLVIALWTAAAAWAAWPPRPWPWLLPLALAPLIGYVQAARPRRAIGIAFAAMLGWNLFTTFWIRHATLPGAVFAVVANALIFTMPWAALALTRPVFRPRMGFIFFVVMWLALERFHFQWELAWPWLTLGNVFATRPEWVQWYAYTGVLGGTLWVWWLAYGLLGVARRPQRKLGWLMLGLAAAVPWGISTAMQEVPLPESGRLTVGCVQPNIDPYAEKFDPASRSRQMDILLDLSEAAYQRGARLIVWPETAVPGTVPEADPTANPYFARAVEWLRQHPNAQLITGAVTVQHYESDEPPTPSARPVAPRRFVDYYNAVVALGSDGTVQIYHKKKLVPGVEWLPYPDVLGVLRPLMADLGGVSGAYGKTGPSWPLQLDTVKVAPAVCYESVFGDYLRRFIIQGAEVLAVVTNDGWWGVTDGHRQHFHYARLRAVELGRAVVRSANTGISAVIDARGRVVDSLGYDRHGVVVADIALHPHLTYYAYAGDVIGRTAAFLFWILLVLAISKYYVVHVKKFPYIR